MARLPALALPCRRVPAVRHVCVVCAAGQAEPVHDVAGGGLGRGGHHDAGGRDEACVPGRGGISEAAEGQEGVN